MAPSDTTYPLHGFKVAMTVALIILVCLLVPLPKSGGSWVLCDRDRCLEESKVRIGSKPPSCVNKCIKCRPCVPTVVVPIHNHIRNNKPITSHENGDDSYYLLSWKCRCGDKLFQP